MAQSYSILLVDDEVDLLDSLKFNLESFGYNVFAATSGNEAYASFKENPFDVVVTDIKMPDGDGVTLVKKITELGSTPVINFVSGFSEISLPEAYHLGASASFPKPFSLKNLVSKISWDLQPLAERWSEPATEIAAALDLEIKQSSLGRGGFTLDLEQVASPIYEIDKLYSFEKLATEVGEISGVAWLRWRKETPTQLGFEFQSLNAESLALITDYIEGQKPVAYIPNN